MTGKTDLVWYVLPRLVQGSVEFTVSNLSLANLTLDDHEIWSMYEGGYGIAEPHDYNPTFRNNHYKALLRLYGVVSSDRTGAQKLMWGMCNSGAPGYDACGCASFFEEPFGGDPTWDGTPQRLRIEWGDGLTRYLRNGAEVLSIAWGDSGVRFGPQELHMTLGCSRNAAVDTAGMPVGAVFSDLVVEGTEGNVASCGGGPADGGVNPSDDDSALVSPTLPTSLTCGQVVTVDATYTNTGTSTWTTPSGYQLGAVDDTDPLSSASRIDLIDVGEHVDPQEAYTFAFPLQAPTSPGTYTTNWRMVRGGTLWFGPVAESVVVVDCPVSSSSAATVSSSSSPNSSAHSASSSGVLASSSGTPTSGSTTTSHSSSTVTSSGPDPASSASSSSATTEDPGASEVGCACDASAAGQPAWWAVAAALAARLARGPRRRLHASPGPEPATRTASTPG